MCLVAAVVRLVFVSDWCRLHVVCLLVVVVCRSLVAVRCSLCVVWCSLLVVCCLLWLCCVAVRCCVLSYVVNRCRRLLRDAISHKLCVYWCCCCFLLLFVEC